MIYIFAANIMSIALISYLMKRKVVDATDIIKCLFFVVLAIIASTTITVVVEFFLGAFNPSSDYIYYGSMVMVEEFSKCIIFYFSFKNKRNIFTAILFGLVFDILETTLQIEPTFNNILQSNLHFFLHSAFLSVFQVTLEKMGGSKIAIVSGLLLAGLLHAANNIIMEIPQLNQYYNWYFAFVFVIGITILEKKN